MKRRSFRLAAGAGALAAGAAAGSVGLAAPEASAETPPPAPLVLTDVASPDLYGAPTTFTVSVSNTSPASPAGQVRVTDVLPAGVTYVSPASQADAGAHLPTVTANPDGTTTLTWSDFDPIGPGGGVTVSFAAQPDVAPTANGHLPGSSFSDSATASADIGGVQSAASSATVPVSSFSTSQNAVPLAFGVAAGPVTDTVTLTGSPGSGTTGTGVDLYLPASVSLGSCGAAPAVCSLPSTARMSRLAATAAGTPAWPLAAGRVPFIDLHWSAGTLAAGAQQALDVPLQVRNPSRSGAPAPAVLAAVSGVPAVAAPSAPSSTQLSVQLVGAVPPPPPPPPAVPPVPAVPSTTTTAAAPAAPRSHSVVGLPGVGSGPAPDAAPAAPAAKSPAARVPAVQAASAALPATSGQPDVPAAVGSTPVPTVSTTIPQAASAGNRNPFLVPGQVEVPASPTTTIAPGVPPAVPAAGTTTTTAAPRLTASPGSLAYTGSDAQGLLALAAGLLIPGAGLLLSSRRRLTEDSAPQA